MPIDIVARPWSGLDPWQIGLHFCSEEEWIDGVRQINGLRKEISDVMGKGMGKDVAMPSSVV